MKAKRIVCMALAVFSAVALSSCRLLPTSGSGQNKGAGQGGITKLVWYYPGKVQDDQDKVFSEINKKLKSKLNVEIEPKVIDTGSYQEKMNMVIASNEEYDLCFTSNWTNNYLPNVLRKAYYPLSDLIAKNAPELLKSLPDYVWNVTKANKEIYAVPNYQVLYYEPALCIPKNLYDKYSQYLQNIKKPTDLEPYLEQIRKNEPDLYPYRNVAAATWLKYEAIFGSSVAVKKGDDSSKVFNPYSTPEYFDYLKLMSDWFNKGYIRPDIAGVTDDTDDLKNLKYAVWDTQLKPGIEYDHKLLYKTDLVYIPFAAPYVSNGAGMQSLTAISANSKNPDQAIKLIALMNSDKEIYNMMCYGLENVHYTKVSDNKIKLVENSKYSPKTDWEFGNQFNAFYLDGKQDGVWEETEKKNNESQKSKLFGFIFDPTNVKTEIANMSSVINEYGYLEKGTNDLDQNYSAFVKKLEDSGVDKVINEIQNQINQWKSK